MEKNEDLETLQTQAKAMRKELLEIDEQKTKMEEELMLLTESLTGM